MLTDGTVCNVDSSISANSKMYLCANLTHVSAGCHRKTHTLLQFGPKTPAAPTRKRNTMIFHLLQFIQERGN